MLYVMGPGRTASTLIGNALNGVTGCFHVGELRDLWRILAFDLPMPCGSGERLQDCQVWSPVLRSPFGRETLDASAVDIYRWQQAVRTSRLPWLLRAPVTSLTRSDAGFYADALVNTYRSIQVVTGCDVVVDTSKAPADAALLSRLSPVPLRLVHLTRDPRAVAYAWSRPKAHLRRYGVVQSSSRWLKDNLASEWIMNSAGDRAIRVRYEDFAANPGHVLRQMLRLVGKAEAKLPLQGDSLSIPPNHTVSGNPDRELTGSIRVGDDRRWVKGLGRARSEVVTTMTLPLLLRYGYLGSDRHAWPHGQGAL